ncbi:unnamed protein product [Rhizophagus irregularis]|nr:unnamed protein product [Rhizophagus irregularis]CAB5314122.1 unnamed protein product [Rhizophagus irregularis]
MWEISSGQPPFANYEDDYDLAMDIVNEGQEAFHSKPYSFNIPENSSNNDGIYNNPNLHPEEQNELEITDDGF